MTTFDTQCNTCIHRHIREDGNRTCDAFPSAGPEEGIPSEIFWNKVDHRKPFPGDNDIGWEAKDEDAEHPGLPSEDQRTTTP